MIYITEGVLLFISANRIRFINYNLNRYTTTTLYVNLKL